MKVVRCERGVVHHPISHSWKRFGRRFGGFSLVTLLCREDSGKKSCPTFVEQERSLLANTGHFLWPETI